MCAAPPEHRRRARAALVVALCAVAAHAWAAPDSAGPAAIVARARALEHGEGVRKDPLQAAALYCEAALAGDAEAQFSLGWMYANGRGLARDDAVAASFFALAATAGHAHAQRALAFVGPDRAPLPACMTPEPSAEVAQVADFEIRVEDPDPFRDLPAWKLKIANVVQKLAPRYDVSPRLALAIIAVESNFDPAARSDKDARGLMQLIPATAARFNVKDVYAVNDNVHGGLAYLRWLLAYYRGQVALAAAAYNAGEAAVDRYGGIPPYAETRDYVQRIKRYYRDEQHPFDPRVANPSHVVAAQGASAP